MSDVISNLYNIFSANQQKIDDWFATTFKDTPPFLYNSVDIRNSGYKIAPVDTNVFPAGFNNLTDDGKKKATEIMKRCFSRRDKKLENIFIIPEAHTRNLFYLDNIAVLKEIVENAGVNVILGNINPDSEILELTSHSGYKLTIHTLEQKNRYLQTTDGIIADLVITNNDFTEGVPEILNNIEQEIVPPVGMGWYRRRKTAHFGTYNDLANRFCYELDIDPWLISTKFEKCGVINFKEKTGIECVARRIDKAIFSINKKYQEYNLTDEPYVYIKSNMGTYGMGIMTAKSGDEILAMNKKIRNKMNKIKGGETNTEVIIQEGVPTIDNVEEQSAEHMIYMVGAEMVGSIYRINSSNDKYGSLNAAGMSFQSHEDKEVQLVTSVIAKLAAYAAAWECYETSYNI